MNLSKRINYPIVEVEWLDAEEHGEVGWNTTKDMLAYARKKCPTMKTVGYLVHKSSTHVALLSTYNEDCCSTVEKIPLGMVCRMTTLVHSKKKTTETSELS